MTGNTASSFATSFNGGGGLALASSSTLSICTNFYGFTKSAQTQYPLGFGTQNNVSVDGVFPGLLAGGAV